MFKGHNFPGMMECLNDKGGQQSLRKLLILSLSLSRFHSEVTECRTKSAVLIKLFKKWCLPILSHTQSFWIFQTLALMYHSCKYESWKGREGSRHKPSLMFASLEQGEAAPGMARRVHGCLPAGKHRAKQGIRFTFFLPVLHQLGRRQKHFSSFNQKINFRISC